MKGASVTFIPQEGGRSANGLTDDEGRFVLTTYEPGDGAVPGEHNVTITPGDNEDVPEVIPDDYDYAAAAESPLSISPEYADPAQSGLKASVSSGEQNEFRFEL